jgi:hypothetical protein
MLKTRPIYYVGNFKVNFFFYKNETIRGPTDGVHPNTMKD